MHLPERVPPGSYQIQAARTTVNPFQMIADFEKTRRTVSVGRDQREVRVEISLLGR